ncbi:branched-chain amino acid aminotransferase, group II [Bernardetia litoralis DSM 6794]|uniref:branched-chain-amino-acid transaminase n=1 Tax=Bernardetia litoralis (strain ATCC 23117 / DSM 6794 / NBRC 15988 / NCIMB 1366 / Fx l1 / Sio-4) TaxID=880071 RepID=I4AFK5_BERLS|nr:branched-chain amino acid aminotransferase [Bernardetia litoralis]AFM02740.1 branched-chain amino acid aminotransferase, group II [Bernardetia litoralis DSM 6794]
MLSTDTSIYIDVQPTEDSRIASLDENNIPFGRVFSDHMFVADYKNGAWTDFKIMPYGNLSLSPAASTLHYSQTIFEGMKAFYNKNDEVVLFRPKENYERLMRSSERMCIPKMDKEIFMQGLKKLIEIDKKWVPKSDGSSLYIRPFIFASEGFLGVRPAEEYKFIIFTCPVAAYYAKPVRVKVETKFVRVASGGTGNAKTGGNYAAALYPAKLAQEQGYDQLIWTDAKEHKYIEESGTMNIMFVIDGKIVTPPQGDTILDGITRKSLVVLAKDLGYAVEERPVTVIEIEEAMKNGSLTEAFGMGTAAVISQIAAIGINDIDYELPAVETRKVSNHLLKELKAIRLAESEDRFGWMEKV